MLFVDDNSFVLSCFSMVHIIFKFLFWPKVADLDSILELVQILSAQKVSWFNLPAAVHMFWMQPATPPKYCIVGNEYSRE